MSIIETFDNPQPNRDYTIRHEVEEFTSVCPKTGHPDFAELSIIYGPAEKCIELKSLKIYLQGFRNEGIFYEAVTNRILDDLVAVSRPKWIDLESRWTTRGGIHSVINVSWSLEDEEDD